MNALTHERKSDRSNKRTHALNVNTVFILGVERDEGERRTRTETNNLINKSK